MLTASTLHQSFLLKLNKSSKDHFNAHMTNQRKHRIQYLFGLEQAFVMKLTNPELDWQSSLQFGSCTI